jgi:hypothetical protein
VVFSHHKSERTTANVQDVSFLGSHIPEESADQKTQAEAFTATSLQSVIQYCIDDIFQIVHELVDTW